MARRELQLQVGNCKYIVGKAKEQTRRNRVPQRRTGTYVGRHRLLGLRRKCGSAKIPINEILFAATVIAKTDKHDSFAIPNQAASAVLVGIDLAAAGDVVVSKY